MRKSNPFIDIIIIVVGLFLIGHYFYKDEVNSISDLKEITGTLHNYSFEEDSNIRHHTYSYYFFLNEYYNSFQINAEFVELFDRLRFESYLRQGDSLKILISKSDYNKFGTREKAFAFGIKSKTREFLNPELAIKDYNSKLLLIYGFGSVIFGLTLLYFDIKRRMKKKMEEEKTNC